MGLGDGVEGARSGGRCKCSLKSFSFYFLRNCLPLTLVRYRFISIGLAISQFLCLSLSLSVCVSLSPSLSLSHMKREVGIYASEESNYNNWIKSLATPDCLASYLVNVASKEYCSICLETALISEEFGIKTLLITDLKLWRHTTHMP